MIVTVLNQKYRCGCGKGMHKVGHPGLLDYFNEIVEWDKCEWPEKEDGTKDTTILGDPKRLEPGNCIVWSGNVLVFDDQDNVVLIVSETGPLSVERFKKAVIDEFEFLDSLNPDVKIEEINEKKPDKELGQVKIGYTRWQTMKDKVTGKTPITLKVDYPDLLLFPAILWVSDKIIEYDKDILDEETINELINPVYLWISQKKLDSVEVS